MTAVQVRRALDELPSDLDSTYARILLRVNENEREVVRRALYWLVAAMQPLKLSQILDGLSIDLGRRCMDRDSGPVHGPALLDALGSLVMHDETTGLVTLSHASVKVCHILSLSSKCIPVLSVQEYLMAKSTCEKYPLYHIDEEDAHTQLALLCMCYVSICLKQSQQSSDCEALPQKSYLSWTYPDDFDNAPHPIQRRRPPFSLSDHPLLAYVQSCGFQHLGHVESANREVLRAIEALQSDVWLHSREWEQLCVRSKSWNTCWPTPKHDLVLFVLIGFAPAPLLRLYISRTQLGPKNGTNPLTYAASFRKIEHARVLLSKGVRLDREGWDPREHHPVLPLEVAARLWDHHMVHLFLTEGSPVPYELFERVVREHIEVPACVVSKLLQTDEFVEWATTVGDERRLLCVLDPAQYIGYKPSEEDLEPIERRLIQIGLDTSVRFEETSLRIAVRAGHVSIVKRMLSRNIPLPPDIILDASSPEMIRFLLRLGSDVHVVSPNGDTPLHLLEDRGGSDDERYLEAAQILVDAGCSPFAYNLAGETPLHVAVTGIPGRQSVAEYYLSSLDPPLPPDILLAAYSPWMIRFLLDVGADAGAVAANGDTVLHVALRRNCYDCAQCLELAQILVDAGCDPCSPNVQGETPFVVAAKSGHIRVVQYLLSLGIPFPSDILLSVVGTSTTPMIEFLLDNGADIHGTSSSGDNLLCVAITDSDALEDECLERVKVLISAGCDTHTCNASGETLFHVAMRHSYATVLEHLVSLDIPVPSDLKLSLCGWLGKQDQSRMIRFFLDNGGNVHAVTDDGNTLLHLAVRAYPEEDALELAEFLIRSGCSPCAFNSAQETPIHIASKIGSMSMITYLLSLGPSLPSDILLTAATGVLERMKMIRYLIQEGADVSATTADGDTPLHQLVQVHFEYEHDRLECVKILIDAGCDPRSKNRYEETPMHLAAKEGCISIVEYLLSQGISPPHDILFVSTARTIRFLLSKGVDIQSTAASYTHPLIYALYSCGSEEDILERVKILISAASLQNWCGESPIRIAAMENYISIIKYLLSRNVALPSDILLVAMPKDGYRWSRGQLFRFLIHEGADVNATTKDGDTPLHLILRHSVAQGRPYVRNEVQKNVCSSVEILLNRGANPFIPNADGVCAADLAKEKGQFFKDNFLRLVRNAIRTYWSRRTISSEIRG